MPVVYDSENIAIPTALPSVSSGACSLVADLTLPSVSAQQVLLGTASNALNLYVEGGQWRIWNAGGPLLVSAAQTGRYRLGFSSGGVLIQGGVQSTFAPLAAYAASSGWLGQFGPGSVFGGTLHRAIVWDENLSASQLLSAIADVEGSPPPPPPPHSGPHYVIDGDSLTSGYGLQSGESWREVLGLNSASFALPSRMAYQIAASAAQLVGSQQSAGDTLVLWAGTNDVSFGGRSAAQVVADLRMACAGTWGAIAVCTAIRRPGEPHTDAAIDALNAALIAEQSPPWTHIVRLDQLTGLTYSDTVHLDRDGQRMVAGAIAGVLASPQLTDLAALEAAVLTAVSSAFAGV